MCKRLICCIRFERINIFLSHARRRTRAYKTLKWLYCRRMLCARLTNLPCLSKFQTHEPNGSATKKNRDIIIISNLMSLKSSRRDHVIHIWLVGSGNEWRTKKINKIYMDLCVAVTPPQPTHTHTQLVQFHMRWDVCVVLEMFPNWQLPVCVGVVICFCSKLLNWIDAHGHWQRM